MEPHPVDSPHVPCVSDCSHDYRPRDQHGRTYCPMAWFHRDRYMVTLGADVCYAFAVACSPSALRCAWLASQAGIPVRWRRSGIGAPQMRMDVVRERVPSFV